MYYDFQTVSRGRWKEVVSPDTVDMINGILAPVIEMLKEDEDDWTVEKTLGPGKGGRNERPEPGPGEGSRNERPAPGPGEGGGNETSASGPGEGSRKETPGPGEENGARLALIPDPIEKDIEGIKGYDGKTFEYVNFLLGQFTGAIGRFFQKGSR